MLPGFEEITHPVTDIEEKVIIPVLVQSLRSKVGKDRKIKGREMAQALKDWKGMQLSNENREKITPARISIMIRHIRINNLIDGLIASSDGYWVTDNRDEMDSHLSSLGKRIRSTSELYDAMMVQRSRMFPPPPRELGIPWSAQGEAVIMDEEDLDFYEKHHYMFWNVAL